MTSTPGDTSSRANCDRGWEQVRRLTSGLQHASRIVAQTAAPASGTTTFWALSPPENRVAALAKAVAQAEP